MKEKNELKYDDIDPDVEILDFDYSNPGPGSKYIPANGPSGAALAEIFRSVKRYLTNT